MPCGSRLRKTEYHPWPGDNPLVMAQNHAVNEAVGPGGCVLLHGGRFLSCSSWLERPSRTPDEVAELVNSLKRFNTSIERLHGRPWPRP